MKTLATLFLLAASLLLRAADAPADSCNHQLYYTSPAAIWEETLPLGNGRLGMMPDGGILREHIVLNEISLWSGMEADYSNPDASKSLPAIRQLLFEGKNREAQELMYSSFVPKKQETDGRYGTYQVLGDLDIRFYLQFFIIHSQFSIKQLSPLAQLARCGGIYGFQAGRCRLSP